MWIRCDYVGVGVEDVWMVNQMATKVHREGSWVAKTGFDSAFGADSPDSPVSYTV